MKSFKEFVNESAEESVNEAKSSYKDVRKWVFDKLENSDMDSEEMEKEFIKKFGKASKADYEKALSEYMD